MKNIKVKKHKEHHFQVKVTLTKTVVILSSCILGVAVPHGKDFLHPGHLTEWAAWESRWGGGDMLVSDGFGLGTGTFTQLREKEGGRGGSLGKECWMEQEKNRGKLGSGAWRRQMKHWTVTCTQCLLVCHHQYFTIRHQKVKKKKKDQIWLHGGQSWSRSAPEAEISLGTQMSVLCYVLKGVGQTEKLQMIFTYLCKHPHVSFRHCVSFRKT